MEETIQSVLQQEYGNWEMLLVDDGSTDNSTHIAKRYAEQYPHKIFYFEHEGHQNKGASLSRNVAIANSTGDYIAFLDADDVWLPIYLKHQLTLLQQHDATMVCEATEYWHNWKDNVGEDTIVPVGTKQDALFLPPQLMLDLYPLGSGASPCICGILIKREAIIKHNGLENSFTGMYDDQTLLTKMYLHENIYVSSTVHNRYRQRPESLVHTSHRESNYHYDRKKFLLWLQNYLKSENVRHPEIHKLLHSALQNYRFSLPRYIARTAAPRAKRLIGQLLPSQVKHILRKHLK